MWLYDHSGCLKALLQTYLPSIFEEKHGFICVFLSLFHQRSVCQLGGGWTEDKREFGCWRKLPLPVSASMLDVVEQLSSCCVLLQVTHFLLHVLPLHPPPTQHHQLYSHMTRAVSSLWHTHTLLQSKRQGGWRKRWREGTGCGRRRRYGSISGVTSHHDLLPSIPPSLPSLTYMHAHMH